MPLNQLTESLKCRLCRTLMGNLCYLTRLATSRRRRIEDDENPRFLVLPSSAPHTTNVYYLKKINK